MGGKPFLTKSAEIEPNKQPRFCHGHGRSPDAKVSFRFKESRELPTGRLGAGGYGDSTALRVGPSLEPGTLNLTRLLIGFARLPSSEGRDGASEHSVPRRRRNT